MTAAADALAQARRCCQAGDYQQAASLCRQVLQADPGHGEARRTLAQVHNSLGVALARQGRLEEAAASLREALRLTPDAPEVHNNLGLVLKELGRLDEALASYEQALRLQPDFAEALSNRALACKEAGRLEEALASIQQALRLRPDLPEAHNNLGLVHKEQGRLDEAAAAFRQALSLRPAYAEAHNNLGNLLLEQGKREAQARYGSSHAPVRPGVPHEQPRWEAAAASLRQALRLRPDYAEAHNNLGLVLQQQRRLPEAEASLREALRLRPEAPEVHNNLGIVLEAQDRIEEALACYRQALRLAPGRAALHHNLAHVLQECGQLAEAEAAYEQALRLRPDYAEAHYALAMLRLLQGQYERAWPGHEWRWRVWEMRPARRDFRQPAWDGAPLAGRTILLHAEAGLGDTLQFVRYAPLVKERGGNVLLESQPGLVPLLGTCPGVDRVLAGGTALPPFDVHLPLLSLPLVLGTTLATVPARVPYLSAEPDLVERWARELGPAGGFRVGIVWQGNAYNPAERFRGVPLAQFGRLARVEGVRLFSLQKGPVAAEVAAAPFPITDLGSRLDETTGPFLDTAAVMKNLDLVICSDSSPAHLAGALGVPTWLAVPFVPDWRWLLEREDSPWYPTMRLFRQPRRLDWDSVFERMAAALAAEVSRPRCRRPIRVEIAPGELIDRLAALAVRAERRAEAADLAELAELRSAYARSVVPSPALEALAAELRAVHEALWQLEEEQRRRAREQDFGPHFTEVARSAFEQHDRRAALRRQIDELLGPPPPA